MTIAQETIKQSLFALTTKGIKYDLDRIVQAAERLGNPQRAYHTLHVAGTNGKGSTCAYLESMLRHAGYTTALFTSPHIVSFEERFQINGLPVAEEQWMAVYQTIFPVIEEYKLSFFEASMLIASELFRRSKVVWAVFETGLGGRLDATNILTPEAAVITRIALDHQEYLGNTLLRVGGEKLGIVKKTTPLIIARPHAAALMAKVDAVTTALHAPCAVIDESHATAIREEAGGVSFTWENSVYTTQLTGRHQVVNALLALETLKRLPIVCSRVTMQQGIAAAFLPARFQILYHRGKTIILDVGHNPDAAVVCMAAVQKKYAEKSVCCVAGIMRDKDYRAMIAIYHSAVNHIIVTQPATDRAAPADLLAQAAGGDASVCRVVADAVALACTRPEEIICITGSFFTVGEAVTALGIDLYCNGDHFTNSPEKC